MKGFLVCSGVAVAAGVAVAVFASGAGGARPTAQHHRSVSPAFVPAVEISAAAAAVRGFARVWWSYDWRQGWSGSASAARRWETPALAARLSSAFAPVWDAGRAAFHEQDVPLRVEVTVEDKAAAAIGFAVEASVQVSRAGTPSAEISRDAEVLVRRVGDRWLVAEVQQ